MSSRRSSAPSGRGERRAYVVRSMAERKSFLVRLPRELLDELERWSKDELRSINAQIEYLLRDAIRRQRGRSFDTPKDDKK